jgi:hypothetical protein
MLCIVYPSVKGWEVNERERLIIGGKEMRWIRKEKKPEWKKLEVFLRLDGVFIALLLKPRGIKTIGEATTRRSKAFPLVMAFVDRGSGTEEAR